MELIAITFQSQCEFFGEKGGEKLQDLFWNSWAWRFGTKRTELKEVSR